jgi:hypothetical protein
MTKIKKIHDRLENKIHIWQLLPAVNYYYLCLNIYMQTATLYCIRPNNTCVLF